ncbi:MAG: hypothetical protein ACOH10_13765 [Rhodoglobus sp.]
MRISVFNSAELQSVILAMKGMDRELAKQIRAANKRVIQPVWQEGVRGNAMTRQEVRVLANTARAQVSDQNITLQAAGIGKALSGGAKPAAIAHSVEFGADRSARSTYSARSSKGRPYTVHNRRTRAQFRPRNLKGYTAYAAAAASIPRYASLWVQTTIRTFIELIEKR